MRVNLYVYWITCTVNVFHMIGICYSYTCTFLFLHRLYGLDCRVWRHYSRTGSRVVKKWYHFNCNYCQWQLNHRRLGICWSNFHLQLQWEWYHCKKKPGSINIQVQRHSISLLPDPFPLGLHALPLRLLDRTCTQAGPTSSLERRVAQHTFTHASLINESSAALTNFPTPCCLMHWASLVRQASALTHERGMRHRR